jgi:tetratricopeptide (TPR) repeat protein
MAIAGMTSAAIAIISPNRLGLALIAFAFVCVGSGCEKPERWRKEDIDRQACLGSRLAPMEALAACSRFMAPVGDRELTRSDAYYNRGTAFAELGEFRHAQLDLEKALELDPRNHWARQGLDEVKQSLSKSGS